MPDSPYLPKAKQGLDYGIVNDGQKDFIAQDPLFMARVAERMMRPTAGTETRAPTPMSRALMFHEALFNPGLGEPHQVAKRAFRGICALLALRRVLSIQISLESYTFGIGAAGQRAYGLERTLHASVNYLPGGAAFWNPLRFVVVQYADGTKQPLLGLSPLTAFFPSPTPLDKLHALYWYDNLTPLELDRPVEPLTRWYDPTGQPDSFGISSVAHRTVEKARSLILGWLNDVLPALNPGDVRDSLVVFGMQANDANSLRDALKDWQTELQGRAIAAPSAAECPLVDDPLGGGLNLPLFNRCVAAQPEADWSLVTDLPVVRGQVALSKDSVKSPSTRVYGRHYGDPAYASNLPNVRPGRLADVLGQGLVRDTGEIRNAVIEALFTEKLICLTDQGVSDEWVALAGRNGDRTSWFLFPFSPQVLDLVPVDRLAGATKIEPEGDKWRVTITIAGRAFSKVYSLRPEPGEGTLDTTEIDLGEVDLRIFPNFDTHATVRDGVPLIAREADRAYYARIRRAPFWPFDVKLMAYTDGTRKDDAGTLIPLTTTARFLRLDFPLRPVGFNFEGRGFCLLDLKPPVSPNFGLGEWRVGVDFGTSNSCVSRRGLNDELPVPLKLPVLTTSLLRWVSYAVTWKHEGRMISDRGMAVLDFFTKLQTEAQLTGPQVNDFPSQAVSQRRDRPSEVAYLDLQNGVVYFSNVSLADLVFSELVEGFTRFAQTKQGAQPPETAFQLHTEFKWRQPEWRRPFLAYLRKFVTLVAAKEGAKVTKWVFSFPLAFDMPKVAAFQADVNAVWAGETVQYQSESEAVQRWHLAMTPAAERVVLDIGGATTDLLAVHPKGPIYQTSLMLAAGQINRYVCTSERFRRIFLGFCGPAAPPPPLKEYLMGPGIDGEDTRDRVRLAWFGLLGLLDETTQSSVMANLRDSQRVSAQDRDPVIGFFLSLAVLFTGLAFEAGRLLNNALSDLSESDRAKLELTNILLTLVGNGSRYYNMMERHDARFERVMVRFFEAGFNSCACGAGHLTQGIVSFDGIARLGQRPCPKELVALGNIWGDTGVDRPRLAPIPDDIAYYRGFREDRLDAAAAPATIPDDLAHYFAEFHQALPQGRNGPWPVVPFLNRDIDLESLYREPQAQGEIARRIRENSTIVRDNAGHLDSIAVEPLFVARLRGVLEGIRNRYGRT